jgi:hypothetical protein
MEILPAFLKLCLLLLISLPMVMACGSTQSKAQTQADIPFLHFQKTPCLGTCPSYEAAIGENGSIRYVGWEHVPVKDTVYFEFTPEEMDLLRQEVKALAVDQLRDTYLTQWSDMPSTITTFYKDGKEVKRVKYQEGGPQALLDFQKALHERIMKLVEAEAYRRLPIK